MCESRAGGYSLEINPSFIVKSLQQETVFLLQRLSIIRYFGFPFAASNGESGLAATSYTQLLGGGRPYIVPRAVSQRSENV